MNKEILQKEGGKSTAGFVQLYSFVQVCDAT